MTPTIKNAGAVGATMGVKCASEEGAMAVFLNERQVGFDTTRVGFPTLGDCMAFVMQNTGGLYGFHLMPGDADKTAQFVQYVSSHIGFTGAWSGMFGTCHWQNRYANTNHRDCWEKEMKSIAKVLGYQGTVSGFNTGKGTGIKHREASYVEYRVAGGGICSIHYKRMSKVTAPTNLKNATSTGPHIQQIAKDQAATKAAFVPGQPIVPVYGLVNRLDKGDTASASLTTVTKGNKGDFHEVKAKDLVTFTV
jgi:hypothetical protein